MCGSGPCTLVSHRHRQQHLREFITLTQAQRVMTVAVGLYAVFGRDWDWMGLVVVGWCCVLVVVVEDIVVCCRCCCVALGIRVIPSRCAAASVPDVARMSGPRDSCDSLPVRGGEECTLGCDEVLPRFVLSEFVLFPPDGGRFVLSGFVLFPPDGGRWRRMFPGCY